MPRGRAGMRKTINMARFIQSIYSPKNKYKYIGTRMPVCRSSWERTMCMFFDNHPSILQWASEPFSVKYRDPLTNKMKNYWPDFLVIFQDANGNKHGEVMEVKPRSQSINSYARTQSDKAAILRNHAKWDAILCYCEHNGLKFRLLNEQQIFGKK